MDREGLAGTPLRYACTQDLDALAPSWSDLCRTLPEQRFVHRPEWYRAIQEHLFRDVAYHCFYREESLVAVFPLVLRGLDATWRDRGLEMPTHADIFVSDAVIERAHLGVGWTDHLSHLMVCHGATVTRFHRVPTRSCLWRGMDGSDRMLRRNVVGGSTYCDTSEPASLSSLSAKHLRNIDRLCRKATREAGPVTHERFVGADAVDTGLEHFMNVEASSWKGPHGKGTSLSCQPEAAAFYRTVLRNFAPADEARVDVLFIGGRPAASHVAVRSGGTWSLLKIGFDDSFSEFGPGNILLKLFVEEMAAVPDVVEVSLVTAPTWAERWHMVTDPVYDLALFSRTPSGVLRAAMHDASGMAHGFVSKRPSRESP